MDTRSENYCPCARDECDCGRTPVDPEWLARQTPIDPIPPMYGKPCIVEIEAPARVQPITYHGHTITAPGFTAETFAAGIGRALSDGLNVQPGRAPKTWLVFNSTNLSEYIVSPFGCSCRAGELNRPCKHRALAMLIEAILTPVDRPGGASS
jgi:hypothetical protein